MRRANAPAVLAALLLTTSANVSGDSFGPEMNIIMTMAGKRTCDVAIRGFAAETNDRYQEWLERHTEQFENTMKKFGGHRFHQAIKDVQATMTTLSKDELHDYCREIKEWVERPLD